MLTFLSPKSLVKYYPKNGSSLIRFYLISSPLLSKHVITLEDFRFFTLSSCGTHYCSGARSLAQNHISQVTMFLFQLKKVFFSSTLIIFSSLFFFFFFCSYGTEYTQSAMLVEWTLLIIFYENSFSTSTILPKDLPVWHFWRNKETLWKQGRQCFFRWQEKTFPSWFLLVLYSCFK